MRRVAALMAAALFAFVPAAEAHRSDTSRVHNIRHIGAQVYGQTRCVDGPMTMPIMTEKGLTERTRAEGLGPGGRGYRAVFQRDGVAYPGAPFTGCRIILDRRRWDTEYLCRVLAGHEMGHAARLEHSSDPADIMWPGTLAYWRPCDVYRWR